MLPVHLTHQLSLLVIVPLLLGDLCFTQQVQFTDCGPGNVKSVTITPCTEMPCIFNLGTVIEVAFDFVSPISADSLTEVIKGIVRNRELPFPGKPKDPCSGFLTPGCPIEAGKEYVFKASFEVKPFYPAIPIEVKYSIATPTGEVVMCIQTGAKILDPNPKPKGRGRKKG